MRNGEDRTRAHSSHYTTRTRYGLSMIDFLFSQTMLFEGTASFLLSYFFMMVYIFVTSNLSRSKLLSRSVIDNPFVGRQIGRILHRTACCLALDWDCVSGWSRGTGFLVRLYSILDLASSGSYFQAEKRNNQYGFEIVLRELALL